MKKKYTKRNYIKKTKRRIKKRFSKKRVKRTYKKKRVSKKIIGGADVLPVSEPLTRSPPLNPANLKSAQKDIDYENIDKMTHEELMQEFDKYGLETDPDKVIERIRGPLMRKIENPNISQEEKEELRGKIAAVSMAGPLLVTEIMTTGQKNIEKIKKSVTSLLSSGTKLVGGPVLGSIASGITGVLMKITGKIYKYMEAKGVSLGKAREEASKSSPKEQHRVLMSLMVNVFMPKYSWLKKTLFLKLCRFWVTGGVLINDMWWARLPVDNPPGGKSDPRFKPSTAEKEFYDRLWVLCKTFIGLGGDEWNQMMKEVEKETEGYESIISKMKKTLESDNSDIKSIKSMLGETFVEELGKLIPGGLEGFGSDSLEELSESLSDISPEVDLLNLQGIAGKTKGVVDNAQSFYNAVLKESKCNEVDGGCKVGTKVKTESGNTGIVVDFNSLPVPVQQTLTKKYTGITHENPVYVSFKGTEIAETLQQEDIRVDSPDGVNYVYMYDSKKIKKDNDTKDKLQKYIEEKGMVPETEESSPAVTAPEEPSPGGGTESPA